MTKSEKIFWRDKFKAAYEAVIQGKSYTINTGGSSRTFTRQDAEFVESRYLYWENEVEKETNGQSGIRKKFGMFIK